MLIGKDYERSAINSIRQKRFCITIGCTGPATKRAPGEPCVMPYKGDRICLTKVIFLNIINR